MTGILYKIVVEGPDQEHPKMLLPVSKHQLAEVLVRRNRQSLFPLLNSEHLFIVDSSAIESTS